MEKKTENSKKKHYIAKEKQRSHEINEKKRQLIHGFSELYEQVLPDKKWFHVRKQPKETVQSVKIRELKNAFMSLTFYDFGCFKSNTLFLLEYGDDEIFEAITVLEQKYNDFKSIIRDLLESNKFDEITEYKLSTFLTDMLVYIRLLKSFNENSAHIESTKSKP